MNLLTKSKYMQGQQCLRLLWLSTNKLLPEKTITEKSGMLRAMLYRNIVELKKMRLIENNDGFVLTGAGRIAIL